MSRTIAGLGTALLTLLAIACAEGEAERVPPAIPPGPTNQSDASVLPGSNDFREEDWTADIVERARDVTGAPMLSAFRIARNADFDRVVFEFAGDEVPSYRVEYVDRPIRQCGSGNVVELRGDGWLSIRLDPAVAHTDEGRPSVEDRAGEVGLPTILEHRLLCDFEGQVEWVLGVSSPNRFRVLELDDPARLAVDIRH